MNDKNFLQAIHSGHTGIELGQNVEMILDLSIIEEKKMVYGSKHQSP